MPGERIILASASKSRQTLLANAGVKFETQAANIDEGAIKQAFLDSNDGADPADLAMLLAATKAATVSQTNPTDLVIGADQLLIFENQILSKPPNMDLAHDTLLRFRGKSHVLESAVCCARAGKVVWTASDRATLHVRNFSPEFLGRYLAATGERVLESVGCYQLEGRGIQLFDKIDGDYFTILGLPLLPLLSFLRASGTVAT